MKEYRDNVCLCDGCLAEIRNGDKKNDIIWNGFNNIDEILEKKRLKYITVRGNVNGRYKYNNIYNT